MHVFCDEGDDGDDDANDEDDCADDDKGNADYAYDDCDTDNGVGIMVMMMKKQ